jgi:hypothetical protein
MVVMAKNIEGLKLRQVRTLFLSKQRKGKLQGPSTLLFYIFLAGEAGSGSGVMPMLDVSSMT